MSDIPHTIDGHPVQRAFGALAEDYEKLRSRVERLERVAEAVRDFTDHGVGSTPRYFKMLDALAALDSADLPPFPKDERVSPKHSVERVSPKQHSVECNRLVAGSPCICGVGFPPKLPKADPSR